MPDSACTRPLIAAATPLARRLREAPRYPLRGAALATLAILSLLHLLAGLLPGLIGLAGGGLIWVSLFVYALECLRQTADGYTAPPEIALDIGRDAGIALLVLQVLAVAAVLLAQWLPLLWLPVLLLLLLLPAMTISLAFGDGVLAALNPTRLGAAMRAFGAAYLLPVGLGAMQQLIYLAALRIPGHLASAGCMLVVFYLVLLNFHVTGLLVHRYHAGIGHVPASELEQPGDADRDLLAQVRQQAAAGDADAAIARLGQRLREAGSTHAMHRHYRELLQRHGQPTQVLSHAREYITALLAEGEVRRALGVAQASLDTDPQFLPAAPEHCAELAEAAAQGGMPRLALTLARAYPNHWPRGSDAARCGLLAARLLAGHFQRPAEAGVLASKLLAAYPQAPERDALQRLLQQVGMDGELAP